MAGLSASNFMQEKLKVKRNRIELICTGSESNKRQLKFREANACILKSLEHPGSKQIQADTSKVKLLTTTCNQLIKFVL